MIELTTHQLDRIAEIAKGEAGLHLPSTKAIFVASRLQRRLRATGIGDFDAYLDYASTDDDAGVAERMQMVSALTTNVTGLYREAHHFRLLAEWLERARGRGTHRKGPISIWSAGCATGEEPLCIAATCRRVLGLHWRSIVRILATDIDAETLAAARDRQDGDADFLARLVAPPQPECGAPLDRTIDLLPRLQAGITYRQHNLLKAHPPEAPFDVVFCRNVTIYFDRGRQIEAHDVLARALRPGGFLALGHSERLVGRDMGLTLIGPTAYLRPNASERSC